jgi:hypothetical protein
MDVTLALVLALAAPKAAALVGEVYGTQQE